MANATERVKKGTVRRTDEFFRRQLATLSAETTFYVNALMGLSTAGYGNKFDDAASYVLDGVVRGREGNPVMAAATAGDANHEIDLHKPLYLEIALASVAKGDIDKPCYAVDDQTATLDPSTRTYANLIGKVVDKVATSIALVELAYDGVAANRRLGAAKFLAATGAQSLSKWDVNKTIFVPNTAAFTITLPAVADCPAGSLLTFVKTTSDAFAATLDGSGAETIDGAATLATVDAQYDTVQLVSNGSAWFVTFRDIT